MINRTNSKNTYIPFFNNPFLNRLSHTSLLTVSMIFIPVFIYFMYLSIAHHHLLIIIPGITLGLFFWTLIEYATHRFAFHFKFYNEKIKYLHSIFHLAHHKYPQDKAKYQTLLLVSIPSSILFYRLFHLVLGPIAEPAFAGFTLGYVIYEYVHFSVHKFKIPTKLGQILKQHHMHHHYFDDTKNFGVTSPLWDHVLKSHLNPSFSKGSKSP